MKKLIQKIKSFFTKKYVGFKPEVICTKNKCNGWKITWIGDGRKSRNIKTKK